jgi:hypothetical protein
VINLAYVGPDTTGVDMSSTTNVKSDVGGWMRPSNNQYIYNLATSRSAKGTYTLTVEAWNSARTASEGIVKSKDIVISDDVTAPQF